LKDFADSLPLASILLLRLLRGSIGEGCIRLFQSTLEVQYIGRITFEDVRLKIDPRLEMIQQGEKVTYVGNKNIGKRPDERVLVVVALLQSLRQPLVAIKDSAINHFQTDSKIFRELMRSNSISKDIHRCNLAFPEFSQHSLAGRFLTELAQTFLFNRGKLPT
jgi:hypothetical protein